MAVIKIKIWPDGSKSEIKVEGVAGPQCEILTQSLEEAVYSGQVSKEKTPEYFQEDLSVINART
jgi:hypothetical protein